MTQEADMTQPQPHETEHHTGRHGGHGWMMIACCIPMLVIAVVLVATGVVSAGFLLFAIGCTAMMFLMMRAMTPRRPADRDVDDGTPR